MTMGGMPSQGDSIETLYVDILARADKLVQDAEAAVQQVVGSLRQIDEQTKRTESAFGQLGGFIKQALSVATGVGLATIGVGLTRSIADFGKQLISTNAQMESYQKSFEVLTGSAEEAGQIINWVREQAKKTPFDIPGLIEGAQRLLTWGLDIQEWFEIIGDTAAAMDRPFRQAADAIGTLASGQTGEAVRRFRDLGVNLREYSELTFDAQGALVTPLEEALPIVRQILQEKFGGMMKEQAKTWNGVMSNMRDTWYQFVQAVGEPLFESLKEALLDIQDWIEDNADDIQTFASDLGSVLEGALNLASRLLGVFVDIGIWIDEQIAKLAGEDWIGEGVGAGRQIVGAGAGMLRGGLHTIGGLVAGESWEQAAFGAADAWRETMLNIAGWSEDTAEKQEKLTDRMIVGVEAVRAKWSELFQGVSDEAVEAFAAQGRAALLGEQFIQVLEDAGLAADGAAEEFRSQNLAVIRVAEVYEEAADAAEELAKQQQEAADAAATLRAEQLANLQLAGEVAGKLTSRLQELMDNYRDTLEMLQAETAATIAKIEADAAVAELDLMQKHQEQMAKAREDFNREQLRRQQQFNQRWERLIREQNDANADAEWEYQYQRQQLLIEGDENALAELEARYEHEKETRDRDQQQERDDTKRNFEEENRQRQEQFELQMRELEERLQQELENIRAEAAEEVKAKKEALEERLEDEEEKLNDRLEKIGGMLQDEVGDNQTATDIILAMWTDMYDEQTTAAINAGITAGQQLDALIAKALAAQSSLLELQALGSTWYYPRYSTGGYTPGSTIQTDPGEWIATADTTRALEQAIGGRLSQVSVQQLSRRVLDVNVKASGVPAKVFNQMYRDLIEAMTEETGVY